MTLAKPPHGAPCNSCGLCCREQLCPLGAGVFHGNFTSDPPGPCPALERDGEREVCGLIAHPIAYALVATLKHGAAAMSAAAASLVGVGVGCDAQLASEPENVEFKAMMRKRVESRHRRASDINRALRMWGCLPENRPAGALGTKLPKRPF